MSRQNELLFVLVLVAGATAASLATSGLPAAPTRLSSVRVRTPCERVQATHLDGSPLRDRTLVLHTNGAIRMHACGPSTLSFLAKGTAALGGYARLVVSQNGIQLSDTQVRGQLRFSVDVPTSGWVMVAFVNASYRPPADRYLWLEHVTLAPRG